MRTLKESILDDIETTMDNGSNWVKEIEKEKKEFLKVISTAKNWEGGWSLKNGRSNSVVVPNALRELGFDANYIRLLIYTNDSNGWISGSWVLEITISKTDEDGLIRTRPVWDKKIRFSYEDADNWRGFIKNIIKPTTKSLDTFKKLLDIMNKYNGRPIDEKDKKLLLK
jgi:hypothetical protein